SGAAPPVGRSPRPGRAAPRRRRGGWPDARKSVRARGARISLRAHARLLPASQRAAGTTPRPSAPARLHDTAPPGVRAPAIRRDGGHRMSRHRAIVVGVLVALCLATSLAFLWPDL